MAKKHAYKKNKIKKTTQQRSEVTSNFKSNDFRQECADRHCNLHFNALDTWFFRESRPHDAVGASELSSLFPPPVRTLIGALRTYLGEQLNLNWQSLDGPVAQTFVEALGNADDLGELTVNGPWITLDGQRLYPAPFYLMKKDDQFAFLRIGPLVQCDLGRVRLPELPRSEESPNKYAGFKNVEQAWLTSEGWRKMLAFESPNPKDVITAEDLFKQEPRLGIARNNQVRTVIESKLYQTQHLRLNDSVGIELDCYGLPDLLADLLPKQADAGLLRLGGEGRMASFSRLATFNPLPSIHSELTDEFIIHFMTPADFAGQIFPDSLAKITLQDGQTVWSGVLNGIELIVESAVIGKVHREGGWDMQRHQPRTVKSFIPAGSAWFCRCLNGPLPWATLYQQLHNQCIGLDTAYGRGHILLGRWQANDDKKN